MQWVSIWKRLKWTRICRYFLNLLSIDVFFECFWEVWNFYIFPPLPWAEMYQFCLCSQLTFSAMSLEQLLGSNTTWTFVFIMDRVRELGQEIRKANKAKYVSECLWTSHVEFIYLSAFSSEIDIRLKYLLSNYLSRQDTEQFLHLTVCTAPRSRWKNSYHEVKMNQRLTFYSQSNKTLIVWLK